MSQPTPTGLTLTEGEQVIWYGRRSWKSLWGWFVAFIFTIWFYGLGIIFLLAAIIIRYSSEYAITNKRAYSRYGLISRKTNDASFEQITDTSFSQGIIGRILNFGDVGVNTAGSAGFEITYKGVSNPKPLLSKIQNAKKRKAQYTRKEERIERLRDRYYTGEISKEKFEEAIRKINEE